MVKRKIIKRKVKRKTKIPALYAVNIRDSVGPKKGDVRTGMLVSSVNAREAMKEARKRAKEWDYMGSLKKRKVISVRKVTSFIKKGW